MASLKRATGWTEALAVRCPTCYQSRKAHCVSVLTGRAKRWAHPARQRAYLDQKDHI